MSASETSVRRNYSLGARRAAVSIVAAWHLGFDLVGTVGTWESYRFPWLSGLAWVLYAAIGVVAGVALLRERPLGAGVWPLAAGALAVSAMVMAACEPGDVVNAADWGWGSVGWLAMILFWPRPTWLRDLSGFLLANVVVTLAGLALAGALDARSLSKFLVVSVGAILLQAGASAGGHALDLAARWAVENSNRTAGAEAARKAADQVHADRLARYAEVRSAVAPVLTLLAEGADPADPDVRHESAVGAARLRRLIAETDDAPDPLLHTLRACAFDVERRGVVVLFLTAGTVPPLPLEVRRALVEAPIEGMARARSQARVTLVATPREVIVSVLTDAPSLPSADGSRAANVATRVEAENGGTQLWIESRWTAP